VKNGLKKNIRGKIRKGENDLSGPPLLRGKTKNANQGARAPSSKKFFPMF